MPLEDVVSKRLEAWQFLSGGGVAPVAYQVNHDQRPAGVEGVSTWALRVRNSVHRTSYVWRRHMSPMMCWCSTRYEVSSYEWTI
jgi:hypothetical protein